MTTLTISRPAAPAVLPVDGPSALVPGTSLRLPVLPIVRHLPAAERCNGCGGTGVEYYAGELATCACMELPEPSTTPQQHGPVYTARCSAQGMTYVPGEGYHVTEVLV